MYRRIDHEVVGATVLRDVLEENLRILLDEGKTHERAIGILFPEINGGLNSYLQRLHGSSSGGRLLKIYYDFFEDNKAFSGPTSKSNLAFSIAELALNLVENNFSETIRDLSIRKIKTLLEDMQAATREVFLKEIEEFIETLGDSASDNEWAGVVNLLNDSRAAVTEVAPPTIDQPTDVHTL